MSGIELIKKEKTRQFNTLLKDYKSKPTEEKNNSDLDVQEVKSDN